MVLTIVVTTAITVVMVMMVMMMMMTMMMMMMMMMMIARFKSQRRQALRPAELKDCSRDLLDDPVLSRL